MMSSSHTSATISVSNEFLFRRNPSTSDSAVADLEGSQQPLHYVEPVLKSPSSKLLLNWVRSEQVSR
jgi:hypothetical protein